MDSNYIKFSKKILDSIKPPVKGRVTYHDIGGGDGLKLRVTSTGSKSFYIVRKIEGKTKWVQIGTYYSPKPGYTITIAEAKKLANDYQAKLTRREVIKAKHAEMQKRTFTELFDLYITNFESLVKLKEKSEKSLSDAKSTWKNHLVSDLAKVEVAKFDIEIAEDLFSEYRQEKSQAIFNKMLTLTKAMINMAISKRWVSVNPLVNTTKWKDKKRHRFMKEEEVPAFFKSLDQESEYKRDFYYCLLFTGRRKRTVQSMRWEEVDLKMNLWVIPPEKEGNMKSKEVDIMPLPLVVVDILKRRAKSKHENGYVFGSDSSKTGYISEKGADWRRIITRAGLYSDDRDLRLRPHDMRRTIGSWLAMSGRDINSIATSLGQNDINTTSIYARMNLDFIRSGMDSVATAIQNAANQGHGKEK